MVKKIYFNLFLIITINCAFSAVNNNPNSAQNFPKLPKYKISQSEKRAANNFLRLFKLSKKGILNKKLIKSLKKDLSKNYIFKDYQVWTNGVDKLVHLKSFKALKDSCVDFRLKTYSSSLKHALNNEIQKICFKRYLKELEEKASFTRDFHKRQIKYINQNISAIMENEKEVIRLLSTLKTKEALHSLYSKALTNHFVLHKTTPSTKLIKELEMTPTLTRYLQTKELSTPKVSYQFFNTLLKYKNSLEDSLDDGLGKKTINRRLFRLTNFYESTYQFLPQSRSNLNMISIAKDFTRAGDFQTSRRILKKVLSQEEHDYTEQSKFELMWTYILAKDYKGAYKRVIQPHLKDRKKMLKNSQLSFWTAAVMEKIGQKNEARKLLSSIIKENPISYYSILSAKKLSTNSPLVANDLYLKSFTNEGRTIASQLNVDPAWLKRIDIWGRLNSYFFIRQEIKEKSLTSNYDEHLLASAKVLSENGDYLDSFKVIISGLNSGRLPFSKEVLEILYPTPYFHQIKQKTAKEFDPVIALSLIRQESGFDRRARSRVGARGLMQLMPATARRYKRRLKTSHLYNPSTNISIGTKYFNNLLSRYDNNLVYSLAAYNAGEHRVDRWQNDFLNNDSILQDIENIPFRETRKYVKLIFRNIFFYKMLLKKDGDDKHKYNQIFDLHLGFNR